ncbi:hypothetical protein [Phenylobacterium sp.]|uniref:hypothetical protein n=1 Tax=Phenylobacterium sp. TaxID=1871053 RepID=UPI0025E55CDF|nr:hypothetical protein [Phenylobacterium sp.]
MELKPGSRWRSAVCSTEVVIVRPPSAPVSLECGGQPLIAFAAERVEGAAPATEHAAGTAAGKRYFDADSGLEVLASKAGDGSLSVGGKALARKDAKALPSSD